MNEPIGMKMRFFLKDYGVKVSEMRDLSGQSGETLRNWYRHKPLLILYLIAAYKWRAYEPEQACSLKPFQSENRDTVNEYFKKHGTTLEKIQHFSDCSPETLRNWINSRYKYMMIDVLIDANRWYKNAIETKQLGADASYEDCCRALLYPITKANSNKKPDLHKFIRKKDR